MAECLHKRRRETFLLLQRYVEIMSLFTWIGNMFAKLNSRRPSNHVNRTSQFPFPQHDLILS